MIRFDHVSRRWPEFAIRNVSLEVAEGNYLVIVGPTGAGKTLLLELLLGIHHPDAGRIFIEGVDVTGQPPERRGIGMVYQDYVLFPHLDVEHNLAFGLRYRRGSHAEHREEIRATVRLLGIEHLLHRFPHTLSGGEKQRVAIGRALVTEPRILLLDEPLSALDRSTAARLRAEFKSLHRSKGLTMLHVTHDLAEARHMGGSIALLNEGQIHGLGTAEELLRNPPTLFAANFVGAVNLYEAKVEMRGGEPRVVAGPIVAGAIAADSPARDAGRTHVMIHPDEVALLDGEASGPGGHAPNLLRGEVTGLADEGNYVAVLVRVDGLPEPLTVYVGRPSVRRRMLQLGTAVIADVRHAIHVLHD